MKTRQYKKMIVAICLAAISNFSFAQWITFDPTNWASNYTTAIASVKAELTQAQSYITQLRQVQNEIRNLKEMGATGFAARALNVESELRAMNELHSASSNLYKSLQGGGDYVQGIQRMINVSNLTADTWLAREKKLFEQKDANATYMMQAGDQAMKTVQSAQQQREKVLSEHDYDEGIRGVAMKTNVLLGNLSTLQSQQIMLMKADVEAKSNNAAIENNLKKSDDNAARKFYLDRLNAQKNAGKIQ